MRFVVAEDGPFPPSCMGGAPFRAEGLLLRGRQAPPRVHSRYRPAHLEEDAESPARIRVFHERLLRPLDFALRAEERLPARGGVAMRVNTYELTAEGLDAARLTFLCERSYDTMVGAGVLRRGADCVESNKSGLFNLAPVSNEIPLLWSLPRFLDAKNGTQNPRSRLRDMPEANESDRPYLSVEVESGRIVAYRNTEQISVRLFPAQDNDVFSLHRSAVVPLYRVATARTATDDEMALFGGFQQTLANLALTVQVRATKTWEVRCRLYRSRFCK